MVERIDPGVVMDRDGWRCHLCDRKIPKNRKAPHPLSASIDHIVPLSLGGEHSYRNVAAAHLGCNQAKRTDAVGEQLRLIG